MALGFHTIEGRKLESRQLSLPDFFSEVRLVRGVLPDEAASQEVIDVNRLVSPSEGFLIAPDGKLASLLVARDPPAIRLFSLQKQEWIGPAHPFHSGFVGQALSDDSQIVQRSVANWGKQARFSKNSQMIVYRPKSTELELVACDTGARLGNRFPIHAQLQLFDGGFSADGRTIWALAGRGSPTELWHWDTTGGIPRQRTIVLPGDDYNRWVSLPADRIIDFARSGPILIELSTGNEVGALHVPLKQLEGFSSDGKYILGREGADVQSAPWWEAATAAPAPGGVQDGRLGEITLPWQQMARSSWSFTTPGLPSSLIFWHRDGAVGQPIAGSRPFVHAQTSSNGQIVLTHDSASEARLWHLESGHPLGPPLGDLVAWRSSEDIAKRRFIFLSDERLLALESDEVVTTLPFPPGFTTRLLNY